MMKKEIIGFIIGTILLLSVLSGCGSTASPTIVTLPPSTTPMNTPINEATPISSPAPTPTPVLSLPVLPGTPVPMPNEPITPENVDRIQQLAMWGKGRIVQIAYSPNEKYIAVGTLAGVWLYDAETLAELHFFNPGNFVVNLGFTPDSQQLILDVGASTLFIWDIVSGELINEIKIRDGYQGNITSSPGISVLSTDTSVLAATVDDQTIGLWQTYSGKNLSGLENGGDTINSLAVSSDSKLLAVGSRDKMIQVWDIQTGVRLYTLKGYDRRKTSLAFSYENSEQSLLAAGGAEGEIWLWNAQTGNRVQTLTLPSTSLAGDLVFSYDARLLAAEVSTPSSKPDTPPEITIYIWRVDDKTLLATLTGHTNGVSSLIFSPDNETIVSGALDGTVRIWNVGTGLLVDTLTGFERNDWGLALHTPPLPAFSSDDRLYVSNPFSFDIELWELTTGHLIDSLSGNKSNVTNLVISLDGSTLASAEFWDYIVRVWDVKANRLANAYETYVDAGYGKSLAINPDGTLTASGDSRAWARVNNTQTGEMLYALPGEQGIRNLAFSSDGSLVASISGETSLDLVNTKTGDIRHRLQTGSSAIGMAFSPDSKTIAIGTQEGVIEIWDVESGKLIQMLQKDDRQIRSLAFSPDGTLLTAGVNDHQMPIGSLSPTIHFWEVQTGRYLNAIEGYMFNVVDLTFSPNGRYLASSSIDGTMQLWGILLTK